jgi:hypothetical protein
MGVVWPFIIDQRLVYLTSHMFPCRRSHSWISGGDQFFVKIQGGSHRASLAGLVARGFLTDGGPPSLNCRMPCADYTTVQLAVCYSLLLSHCPLIDFHPHVLKFSCTHTRCVISLAWLRPRCWAPPHGRRRVGWCFTSHRLSYKHTRSPPLIQVGLIVSSLLDKVWTTQFK